MKESFKIIGVAIGAAVGYGIVHDMITAHLCVEYFTEAHPPLFNTSEPALLALGWGIVATWWVGALLGGLLALASQAGARPKLATHTLWRPVSQLLLVMALCAALAGVMGWLLSTAGIIGLWEPLDREIPPERHPRFLAVAFAHTTSYAVGFIGGLFLIGRTWRMRQRL